MGGRALIVLLAALAAVTPGRAGAAFPRPPPLPPPDPAALPAPEPVAREPLPPIEPAAMEPTEAPRPAGLPGSGTTWIDSTHSFVANVLGTVLRFDRFFADESELDLERSRSFLRWRNDLRYGEDTDLTFRTSLRADLKLPGLNRLARRLRLVITGETEDTLGTLFPDEENAGRTGEVGRADAELRYGLIDSLRTNLSLGGGVLVQLPPGLRLRARFRHAFPVGGDVLVRMGTTGFWESRLGFGNTLLLEVERRFGTGTLVRFGNGATITEESPGWEWGTGVTLLQRLGLRTGVALGGSMVGDTDPYAEINRYRVFTRIRRDFFRRWLYYEVEPEVLWPVVDAEVRRRILGVTFRLEVQFHGTEMLDRQELRPDRAGLRAPSGW